ncbi:MAG: tetratricopeptide repeat protein [Promethearchaeota archaeon]
MVKTDEIQLLKQIIEQGKYTDALNEAERLEKKYTELGKHLQLADTLILKLWSLHDLGRLEEGLKVIKQCEFLLTSLNDLEEVKKRKAYLMRYSARHDKKKALEYIQESLKLSKEVGDKEGVVRCYLDLSHSYHNKGKMQLGLKYLQQAKALSEEIGDTSLFINTLFRLGYFSHYSGNYAKAKEFQQQVLTLSKEHGYSTETAWAYHALADLNWELGNEKQALEYYQQSDALFEETGQLGGRLWTLFEWFSLSFEMNSLDQAHHLLQRLQQLYEEDENIIIRPFLLLAQATLLRTSSRLRDKAKAQNILYELVEGAENIFFKIVARINLCDSLLEELKSNEDSKVFQEALKVVQEINSLTQHVRLFSFTVKLLLLQAKFATVEGDLSAALNFYEQAKTFAKDKGIGVLAAKAEAEKVELETQYDKWQQLIQSNAPFKERLKQSRLEEYLREAKRIIRLSNF